MKDEVEVYVPQDNLPDLSGSDAITATAAAQREAETVRVLMLSARKWPRAEETCRKKALAAFTRPRVAVDAEFRFPRGGQPVEGPTVYLAREIARHWGNIQYGAEIVSQDAREVHVRAYAWDMETNQRVTGDDRFNKLQQRKNKRTGETRWEIPDERDLRELVNKRGAILIRNCLLQILPSDLVDECIENARRTIRGEAGEEKARAKLLAAFESLQVTQDMLEQRLGHPFADLTKEEYVELVGLGKAIKDGQAKVEDFFGGAPAEVVEEKPEGAEPETLDDLMKERDPDEYENALEKEEEERAEAARKAAAKKGGRRKGDAPVIEPDNDPGVQPEDDDPNAPAGEIPFE